MANGLQRALLAHNTVSNADTRKKKKPSFKLEKAGDLEYKRLFRITSFQARKRFRDCGKNLLYKDLLVLPMS